MEVNIYNAAFGNLIPSAVRLLEKIYSSGGRCVFFSPIEERVKIIDKALWTFSTNAFIPHGDESVGFREHQPIYFTNKCRENPNNASVIFIVDSLDYESLLKNHDKSVTYEKIIFMFEDIALLNTASNLYDDLKKNKENVNYWKQSSNGWEKITD